MKPESINNTLIVENIKEDTSNTVSSLRTSNVTEYSKGRVIIPSPNTKEGWVVYFPKAAPRKISNTTFDLPLGKDHSILLESSLSFVEKS